MGHLVQSPGSVKIIGYTVKSLDTSEGNDWWRIIKPPAFAADDGTLEFFAMVGKWYGNSERFRVTVCWITMARYFDENNA